MMMNALSQVSKDTDIGKQMAYMRNYINQLRDEIENDLMNIGYDNLDADLRKRFDDMQTGLLTANNTSMEVAGLLKTKYLTADEITANYLTAQQIAATYVTTSYLTTNYLNATQISSNYATIGSLNAVSAEIGSLEAIAITTNNLQAQSIKASQITVGKIKASQIDTDSFASFDITCKILDCTQVKGTSGEINTIETGYIIYNANSLNFNGDSVSLRTKTISGVTFTYLGSA